MWVSYSSGINVFAGQPERVKFIKETGIARKDLLERRRIRDASHPFLRHMSQEKWICITEDR